MNNLVEIIAFSDTHGEEYFLSNKILNKYNPDKKQVLIHVGDACNYGTPEEGESFLNWFGKMPYKNKIFIPGNHDKCFDFSSPDKIRLLEIAKQQNINVILNDVVNIEGIKILCSSNMPDLKSWGFYSEKEQRERFFNIVDNDVDLVVSHCPAFSLLDYIPTSKVNVGCQYLLDYIKKNEPRALINGHIHESFGNIKIKGNTDKDINIYNVAIMNEKYCVVNDITSFELEI